MIIFITGATAGFGLSMTRRFIKNGHKVVATGRRIDRLNELKREFSENIFTIQLDVKNKSEVKKSIDSLPSDWKKIDVLINNAGLALGVESAECANLDDWEEMVQTNINGMLYLTHEVLPLMINQKRGHIVNLGSVAGEFPYPGGNVYGATKAFVHQFSLNLRSDLLGKNIRVTNIEPGMCQSEFSLVRFKGDSQKADQIYKGMTPLSAEDIAETIDWVISRPQHININVISLMPTDQAFAGFAVNRN
jgi:3-hydroxy acid dehydrogenase/malonic semialdehyde reductase